MSLYQSRRDNLSKSGLQKPCFKKLLKELYRRCAIHILPFYILAGCQSQPEGQVTKFTIEPLPSNVQAFEWVLLAEDLVGDGRQAESADAKAFSYYYDKKGEMLWFKFELHNAISKDSPAVSVAMNTNLDQKTGARWWGTNSTFRFNKMLSVGPIRTEGESYWGYNGITNEEGILSRNWINEKQGVLNFHIDPSQNAYFMGIKRSDLGMEVQRFHLIGSVGANALWNDDFGEEGFSTLDLTILGQD